MKNGKAEYRQALLSFVGRSDLTYRPRQAAYEALGLIVFDPVASN